MHTAVSIPAQKQFYIFLHNQDASQNAMDNLVTQIYRPRW